MWWQQKAANTNALTTRERIQALRARTNTEVVQELRELLYPLLTKERLREGNAPLILQLLKIRLDHGNLVEILKLRRRDQVYDHEDVVFLLQEHDADYLEQEATIIEELRQTFPDSDVGI